MGQSPRFALVGLDRIDALVIQAALRENPRFAQSDTDILESTVCGTDEQRLALLERGYDVFMVRLGIANYATIKLFELAHRLGLQSRFVIVSGTRAPPDIIENLFGCLLSKPYSIGETLRAVCGVLDRDPKRLDGAMELDGAIAAVLATASCFRKGSLGPSNHHSTESTLDEYRRESQFEDCPLRQRSRHAPKRLFISYSHQDEVHRRDLDEHLSLLKREAAIAVWHDRKIDAGNEWKKAIDREIAEAHIVLFLVSPSFMDSRYCYEIELQTALARQENGDASVIPVIVRPVDWRSSPLGRFQALPRDGKPVTTWTNLDEAWLDVVMGIRRAAGPRE